MKIWLKRVLISLVVLFIVALVGAAIFLLTFDPNAYKSKLEQFVYQRYHRTLSIQGDIELSLFPRIGLAVQDVSLSDRDNDDTFASIGSARVAVAIWPLLFSRLVVDHVAITGLKAWLVRDPDGRFNFRDLIDAPLGVPFADAPSLASPVLASFGSGATMPAMQSDAAARVQSVSLRTDDSPRNKDSRWPMAFAVSAVDKADFQVDIAGLELKGGEINFYDRKTGAMGRLERVELNTGRVTFDQPFDVALKGQLRGDVPHADAALEAQALLRVDPLRQDYSAQRVNLQLKGMLGELDARVASLRGDLAYNDYSQMFSAAGLELQVQGDVQGDEPITGLEAGLSVPQLRMDRSLAELQVSRLALRAKGARPDSSFDVALDAPSLSVSPEIAKGEPISGTIKRSGPDGVLGVSMQLSGLGGNAYDLKLNEIKLESTYKQDQRALSIKMSSPATWNPFRQRGSLSAMKGDVRIEDEALSRDNVQFPFIGSLQADLIEDDLTTEINAVLNGSKLDFRMAASQLSQPRVAFDLTADDLDLDALFPPRPDTTSDESEPDAGKDAAPESGSAPAAVALPQKQFDWGYLRAANVHGTVAVRALTAAQLKFEGLKARLDAQDGLLTLSDIKADLYGGTLASNVGFSADHNVTADLALNNVDMGPLTKILSKRHRLAGRSDVGLSLAFQGKTPAALMASTTGQVSLDVHDGAWVGLDLNQTVNEAGEVLRNVFSGQLPNVVSRYDAARRTQFDTLNARATFVQGQGTIDTFDLTSPTVAVHGSTPASIDLVNQQLNVVLGVSVRSSKAKPDAAELAGLKGIELPLRVAGPFRDLTYTVQWQDISDRVVKDAIQDGLLDTLENPAGSVVDSLRGMPQNESDPDKSDPIKSIGDALRGLLKQ